jgi:hypothetical protein
MPSKIASVIRSRSGQGAAPSTVYAVSVPSRWPGPNCHSLLPRFDAWSKHSWIIEVVVLNHPQPPHAIDLPAERQRSLSRYPRLGERAEQCHRSAAEHLIPRS